jgi:hypothetical protein
MHNRNIKMNQQTIYNWCENINKTARFEEDARMKNKHKKTSGKNRFVYLWNNKIIVCSNNNAKSTKCIKIKQSNIKFNHQLNQAEKTEENKNHTKLKGKNRRILCRMKKLWKRMKKLMKKYGNRNNRRRMEEEKERRKFDVFWATCWMLM